MARRCHRTPLSLSGLIDRAVERAFRSQGFRSRAPRSRRRPPPPPQSRTVKKPAFAPSPPATHPELPALSPELQAYMASFPPFPAWMKSIRAEDLVVGVDPDRLPAMADAEDGEQPWDDTPLATTDAQPRGWVAFPFVGPPEASID